jgi:hypothetical protein
MECREPLEQLQRNLLRRGLPRDYVNRAVQELADHHADLVEAAPENGAATTGDAAWQRLGNVDSISKELARKYHQRTFAGRHPVLTFVIAPFPAMLLFWVATFAVTWGTISVVGSAWLDEAETSAMRDMMQPENRIAVWSAYAIHFATLVVPPVIGALWYCRLARRSGRGIRWAAAACALVTLLACLVFSDLRMPVDEQHGTLVIGLNVTLLPWDWRLPSGHYFQTLAPLAVLAFAAWRAYREQPVVRVEEVPA